MATTSKQIQKRYENAKNQFDPWKQQLVFNLTDGSEMVLELTREDREFTLFHVGEETVKTLKAIDEKVAGMIAAGQVMNVYVDSL